MHETLESDHRPHEASSVMDNLVDDFAQRHELGSEPVQILPSEALKTIEAQLTPGESVDDTVAVLVGETRGEADEQFAADIGTELVYEQPESASTVAELDAEPVEVLETALHDLEEREGIGAAEQVAHSIDSAEEEAKVRIAEIEALSRDTERKAEADKRNREVTLEAIWQESTLHHVTPKERIQDIAQNGLFANGKRPEARGHGNVFFGPLTEQVAQDASNEHKIRKLGYSGHAGGDVYIHVERNEDSYRPGVESKESTDTILFPNGLPSTEISALTLNTNLRVEDIEGLCQTVMDTGFYIPIFNKDGTRLFTAEDFDSRQMPEAVRAYRAEQLRLKAASGQNSYSSYDPSNPPKI